MARLSVATTPDSGVQRTNIIFHHYTFLWEVPWDDIVEGPQREKNREKQNHSPASWPSSGNKHFFLCCFSWKHLITNHLNISHHKKYGGRTFNILVHITCIGTWTDLGWQLVTGTSLTDQNWFFLGPRGPLRTPLVSVVRCPRQKITQPLIILFQTLS